MADTPGANTYPAGAVVPGVTPVTNGTSGWFLYNNAGIVALQAGGGGATPGGTTGQVQANAGTTFSGFTVVGDATLDTATGTATVSKTQGVAFALLATTAVTAGVSGQVFAGSTGASPAFVTVGGDALITNAGSLTVSKTNNVAFGALATAVVTAGTSGQAFLGTTGATPAFVTISGDGSVTNAGTLTITKTNNVAFATLATAVVTAGNSGQVFAGSTGATPAFVTVGGDGTITNAGAFTVSSAGGNLFGRLATAVVTAGSAGQVFLGSTGATPAFQTLSGDGSVTNTGVLTVTKTQNVAFGALGTAVVTAGTSGQLFLGSTGVTPAFQTLSQDGTITNTGVLTITKTQNVAFGALGTAVVTAGTSGQLFLGTSGATPAFQTLSQDGTVTNTGVLSVTKTQNVAFAASATTNALNATNINAGTIGTSFVPLATTAVGYPLGFVARIATAFPAVATTTLTNVTGLSVTLATATNYVFRTTMFALATTTGGIKAAIGGTLSATTIVYTGYALTAPAAVGGYTRSDALAGAVAATTAVATATIYIDGFVKVNTGGTLTTQFAQNAAVGASTVSIGSWMEVWQA